MCGIVGYISTKDETYRNPKDHFLKYALSLDTVRGDDSTGIMSYYEDGSIRTIKTIMPGDRFVQTKTYEEAHKEGFATIGHNRAATMGAVTPQNAHPFVFGDISLVHNGVLHAGGTTLPSYEKGHEVDSMQIALGLSKVAPEQAKDFIETIDGDFALIWFDKRNSTVNLCRNPSRPLHITMNHAKDCMFIMSDGDHLNALNKTLRSTQAYGTGIWSIDAEKILTFKKGSLVPEITPFKTFVRPTPVYHQRGNWRDTQYDREWEEAAAQRVKEYEADRKKNQGLSTKVVGTAKHRMDSLGKKLNTRANAAHVFSLDDLFEIDPDEILSFMPKIILQTGAHTSTVWGTVGMDDLKWGAMIHRVPTVIANAYKERAWAVQPIGIGDGWGALKDENICIVCNYIDWNLYAVRHMEASGKKQEEAITETEDQLMAEEEQVRQAVKESLVLDCNGDFINALRFREMLARGCISCGGVLIERNKSTYAMANERRDILCSACRSVH